MKIMSKKAFNLILVSCFFIGGGLLGGYSGIGFPQYSQLQYTSGTLAIVETRAGDNNSRATNNYPAFYDKKMRTIHEFSCAYTAINIDYDGCGSDEDFAPYIGKYVKIGWYEQDALLGIKNKRRQLITLTFEDILIRSYEDTLAEIRADQKFNRYYLLFLLLVSIGSYRLLNKTD